MASINYRKDSSSYWITLYPCPGEKPIRGSLETTDLGMAERMKRKLELMKEMQELDDVTLPTSLLYKFCERFPEAATAEVNPAAKSGMEKPSSQRTGQSLAPTQVDLAIDAYLIRSHARSRSHKAIGDKVSRLRQFFGSAVVNELDPRTMKNKYTPPDVPAFYQSTSLMDLNANCILRFLVAKNYSRSDKRHYREVLFGLFRCALINGIYTPTNPYAPNPAGELPTFKGRTEPVTILNPEEVEAQYAAASSNPEVEMGCRLMIEGGFRLHEALAIGMGDVASDLSSIRLRLPGNVATGGTRLKTGERTVTVREPLKPFLAKRLKSGIGPTLVLSTMGSRWNSDGFGKALQKINTAAGLKWTSQDYRHTFATERIREGWNLKTLSDEMGTSVNMLCEYYAGFIAPPVLAASRSLLGKATAPEHA